MSTENGQQLLNTRNLSESQRAMAAYDFARSHSRKNLKVPHGERTHDFVSKMFNISPTSYGRAKVIYNHGTPEIIQAIEQGRLSVWAGYSKVRGNRQNVSEYQVRETKLAIHPIKNIKRGRQVFLSQGSEMAMKAMLQLDRINLTDTEAREALQSVLDYCYNRLHQINKLNPIKP